METNRTYISYSQYALFKSSPKAYYEKYALGKTYNGTKYQNFGKALMEDLEFGEDKGIPQELIERTTGNLVEKEITVRPQFFDRDLFGIIDVVSEDFTQFDEFKTGKKAWDVVQVMKNEQVLFYALMIYLKHNVIPIATLVWAETREDEDGSVVFTGLVKTFKRKFDAKELEDYCREVAEVCLEISDYEHSIVAVDESKDVKLLRLLTEKKRIDEELDLLKSEIMVELKEFDNKYAESENFNITLAKRKTYTYSEDLKLEEANIKADLKRAKALEVKEGIATYKESEYLLIKPKK